MAGKRRPHWLLRAWATFTALDLAVHIGMAKSPAHAMHHWVDDWLVQIAFALIILPVCCIPCDAADPGARHAPSNRGLHVAHLLPLPR